MGHLMLATAIIAGFGSFVWTLIVVWANEFDDVADRAWDGIWTAAAAWTVTGGLFLGWYLF